MVDALKKEVAELKKNEAKWSKPLMDAGWNAFPSIIIEKQQALGLDAIDMNIILHLSSYWWTADNLPHPSVGKIASAIGVTPRTIQKRIKALEDLGLMRRQERRNSKNGSDTNLYSFDGLIKAVRPHAEEKVSEIAERKRKEQERINRKKPKLHVVPKETA